MAADLAADHHEQAKLDVKSQVARALIDAMEKGDTPWQRPWRASAMRPTNATTGNAYRGINRILLALAGRSSNLWMTYRQAEQSGYQVRRGEKGAMVVKVVELERDGADRASKKIEGASRNNGEREAEAPKGMALKRYVVFNAEQIDGMPPLPPELGSKFEAERAEGILRALQDKTGLIVVHGGGKALYRPSRDEIALPPKAAFKDVYSYYSTAHHEAAHSTMAPHRLNRTEAYAKRWGDAAYALEELTAEIACAILASETGVPTCQDAAHVEQHGAYLRSWIKVISDKRMAIFAAAKNADLICDYLLTLYREMAAVAEHADWVAEYAASEAILLP